MCITGHPGTWFVPDCLNYLIPAHLTPLKKELIEKELIVIAENYSIKLWSYFPYWLVLLETPLINEKTPQWVFGRERLQYKIEVINVIKNGFSFLNVCIYAKHEINLNWPDKTFLKTQA